MKPLAEMVGDPPSVRCAQCRDITVRLIGGEFLIQKGCERAIYTFTWLCVMCLLKQIGLFDKKGRFMRKEAKR